MKKKSKVWIISAAMTIILAILTVNTYLQLSQGTLPPNWGGFAVGIALVSLFGAFLFILAISAILTFIYAAGFYWAGLIISAIISVFAILTLPPLFLLILPHLIAGVIGVR